MTGTITRSIPAQGQTVQGQLALSAEEPVDIVESARCHELEEEPEFYWSSTRLRLLLQCPRRFRYAYVDKIRTVPSAALIFGRLLHEVIRCAHEEQMVTGALPAIEVLLQQFDEAWTKLDDNVELRYSANGPSHEKYSAIGREMLRVFRSTAALVEPPLAVEMPFEIELDIQVGGEPRTIRVRGVIDRLDEIKLENGEPALIVVDYKSNQRKITPAEAQEEIQLTIYALAAQHELGLPVEQVELCCLRDGETIATPRTTFHLSWLIQQVLPYAQRTLEQGKFPAQPSYRCCFCEFRQLCDDEGPGPQIEPLRGGEEDAPVD